MLLIYKWICEKFSYRFDGLSKTLFFYFDFDDFLTAFAKYLMKRPPVFMIDIKKCINYYPLTKIWGLEIFGSEIKIFTETRFHCLFSLNEKIIAMCYLMIDIKCVAIICLNEIWSSFKRPFWNNGPSKTVNFWYKFLNFILSSTTLPIFTTSNMLLLKWRSFHYNTEFGKKLF